MPIIRMDPLENAGERSRSYADEINRAARPADMIGDEILLPGHHAARPQCEFEPAFLVLRKTVSHAGDISTERHKP
ncbi:hypothetical protein AZF01_08695 [Martelella sp. AD-3]|nr:hypothetical protein AZF01_08695 [Martelella sp. AD-3]